MPTQLYGLKGCGRQINNEVGVMAGWLAVGDNEVGMRLRPRLCIATDKLLGCTHLTGSTSGQVGSHTWPSKLIILINSARRRRSCFQLMKTIKQWKTNFRNYNDAITFGLPCMKRGNPI